MRIEKVSRFGEKVRVRLFSPACDECPVHTQHRPGRRAELLDCAASTAAGNGILRLAFKSVSNYPTQLRCACSCGSCNNNNKDELLQTTWTRRKSRHRRLILLQMPKRRR